jgi:hypothetical protein
MRATEEKVVSDPEKPGIQKSLLNSVDLMRKATSPAIATPRRFTISIAIG